MFEYALSILSILKPFPFIIMSLWCLPYSESIFHSFLPITFKNFSVIPFKNAFSSPDAILIPSYVSTIYISLKSNNSKIVSKLSFKDLFIWDKEPKSMSFIFFINFSEVNTFLVSNNFEIWFP